MAGLVQTIFKSIPALGNIMLLFLFFVVVFGIIGMQLFGGNFRNKCVNPLDTSDIFELEGNSYFCHMNITEGWHSCPDGYSCTNVGNPESGLANYDNMLFASLRTFELITLEGWTNFMYQCRDYYGNYYYDLYCYCSVFIGAFVILNLMVAV